MNDDSYRLIEILKGGKTAVLCGAGVSYNSGIPLVEPLMKYMLSEFGIEPEDIGAYMTSKPPFENFIEAISHHLQMDRLYDAFDTRNPNDTHFLLVSLLQKGFVNTIYTTNFDINLEISAQTLGLAIGTELTVVKEPGAIQRSMDSVPSIVKLHGCIEEDRAKLGITIRNIASKQSKESLRPWVKYLLVDGPHTNVLILGYSFSDKFDIGPLLQEYGVHSNKSIYNINHDRLKPEGAFAKITTQSLSYLQIDINTDIWVERALTQFGIEKTWQPPRELDRSGKSFVDRWLEMTMDNFGVRNKFSISSHLFAQIVNRRLIEKYSAVGIANSAQLDATAKFDLYGLHAGALANYRYSEEELSMGLNSAYQAYLWGMQSGRSNLESELMRIEGIWGCVHQAYAYKMQLEGKRVRERYHFDLAIKRLTRAVNYFGRLHDGHQGYERLLGFLQNLAIAIKRSGNPKRALAIYNDVKKNIEAEIEKGRDGIDSGSLRELYSEVLYNIGALFDDTGQYPKALEFFTLAHEKHIEMGMEERAKIALRDAIKCLKHLGLVGQAKIFYDSHPYGKIPFEIYWTNSEG